MATNYKIKNLRVKYIEKVIYWACPSSISSADDLTEIAINYQFYSGYYLIGVGNCTSYFMEPSREYFIYYNVLPQNIVYNIGGNVA